MRFMTYIIITCGMIFISLSLSYGQMANYVDDYFHRMEAEGGSVFASKCLETGGYTVTIVFEAGANTGILIEEKNNHIVNIANISISKSGLKIGETNGGIYSMERVKKLVSELSEHNFILISPFSRKALASYSPGIACRNVPRGRRNPPPSWIK